MGCMNPLNLWPTCEKEMDKISHAINLVPVWTVFHVICKRADVLTLWPNHYLSLLINNLKGENFLNGSQLPRLSIFIREVKRITLEIIGRWQSVQSVYSTIFEFFFK